MAVTIFLPDAEIEDFVALQDDFVRFLSEQLDIEQYQLVIFNVAASSVTVQLLILPKNPDKEMPQSEVDRIIDEITTLPDFPPLGNVTIIGTRSPGEVAPEPEEAKLLGIGLIPVVAIAGGCAVALLLAAIAVLLMYKRTHMRNVQQVGPVAEGDAPDSQTAALLGGSGPVSEGQEGKAVKGKRGKQAKVFPEDVGAASGSSSAQEQSPVRHTEWLGEVDQPSPRAPSHLASDS